MSLPKTDVITFYDSKKELFEVVLGNNHNFLLSVNELKDLIQNLKKHLVDPSPSQFEYNIEIQGKTIHMFTSVDQIKHMVDYFNFVLQTATI